MPLRPMRLLTIPISHYCEKVRWALQRQGLPFIEEGHAPVSHALHTLSATGLRSRTVPVLIDDNPGERHILADSTDCLRYLASRYHASWLYAPSDAAALEEDFDNHLGPHTRRLVYFYLLPDTEATKARLSTGVSKIEASVTRLLFPVIRRAMQRTMRIDLAGVERSRKHIDEQFARVAARLADGRRYLCGDALSAADIAFASLAAPVLLPKQYGVHPLPEPSELAPELREQILNYRQTPAGVFVLRLFAEERRLVVGQP